VHGEINVKIPKIETPKIEMPKIDLKGKVPDIDLKVSEPKL
jgi:hypothetical protein